MKYTFSAILLLIITLFSISLLPPPLTSPVGIVTAQIPLNIIQNSCIVNNANIAIQNASPNPLDATNNWWGMPTGATHDGFASGDAVGQNILFAPHLPAMPFPCDLASADWIPFSEQELQFAINQNLPNLRGIGFALLDMQWGYGAKFSLVSKPDYGNIAGEAYIRITPSPDGAFMTLTIDITRLPTDPTLSQIATCELMPLFLNSIGQVQHKLAPTVSDIDHIVPMESHLMVRFAPNAPEITPEPAPPLVMDYDSSCLPPAIPQPTPTLTPTPISTPPSELEELIEIPPMEGETELTENNNTLQQTSPIFLDVDTPVDDGNLSTCEPNILDDCSLRGAVLRSNVDIATHYVIKVPNATYNLASTMTLQGYITLVGEGFYAQPQNVGAIIQSSATGSLFYIQNANAALYNLKFTGGINGMVIAGSQVQIYHSRFYANSAGLYGGAIHITSPNTSSVQIKDTVFSLNLAIYGGAIGISADAQTSDLSVQCSTFDRNSAEYGGVIYTTSNAQAVSAIDYSNFYNNTAIFNGGAIYNAGTNYTQIRWSYATSPTISGFVNYDAPHPNPNSIINAPMAIETSYEPVEADCYIPAPPTQPPPPTGIPPQIAQCLDTSRDPIAQKDAIIADCLVALAWYGVSADASGLTSAWSTQASFARAWTVQELQGIMTGVENTAKAFFMLKYSGQAFDKAAAKTLFNTVMGNFSVLRVNNNINAGIYFKVDNDGDGVGDECVNVRSSACTANYAQIITFYDNIFINVNQGIQGISEYLIVHEMGHRFNALSDGGGPLGGRTELSLFGRFDGLTVANTSKNIYDNSGRLVMGIVSLQGSGGFYNDWARGKRGWGSGPHAPFDDYGYLPGHTRDQTQYITNFQQNSFTIDNINVTSTNSDDATTEIDEATADMFLNWVYSKAINPNSGFKDWSWTPISSLSPDCIIANIATTGCADTANPGQSRFARMETEIRLIFAARGW